MLFEKLTENDLKILDILRRNYIKGRDGDFFSGEFVDNKTFLRFWETAKAPMIKAFGGRLIMKKPVNVQLEDDDLNFKMRTIFWIPEFASVRDAIYAMVKERNEEAWGSRTVFDGHRFYSLAELFYYNLFDSYAWAANRYDGPTFEIKLSDGSTMKLAHDCKLMKALGRMAKACGNHIDEQFEAIRLRQSQVLNEARINANLYISIHPLDFLTASYNANNWRSCMSWEDGEWRRGVIEMMNSPIVVCAFIVSRSETLAWYNGVGEPPLEWNSKRWREFFIVRPDMISGIKGYPYWNRALEDEAITMLRDMFAPVFGVNYSSTIYHWEVDRGIEDKKWDLCVKPNMQCGPAMYNDFRSDNDYHAVFVRGLQNDSESRRGDCLPIFYSGESECVVCGNTNVDFYGEREIVCKSCVERFYCCKCGDPIYNHYDLHEVGGRCYCHYCYEQLDSCDVCDEVIDTDNDEGAIRFCISWDESYNGGSSSINDVLRRAPDEGENDWPYSDRELIVRSICGDCAEKVFTTGRAEIDCYHNYHTEGHYYYVAIPISRLTEYGIKVLGIAKDVEYFKAMHWAK